MRASPGKTSKKHDVLGEKGFMLSMANSQDFGTLVTTTSSSKSSKDKPDFAAK